MNTLIVICNIQNEPRKLVVLDAANSFEAIHV